MVGRKVQGLEVIVVGLDLRAFSNRVTHSAKDAYDLIHGADHRMLSAQRTNDAREGDVDALTLQPRFGSCATATLLGSFDTLLNLDFKLVDPGAYIAFGATRSGFQPQIINLGEDAILARHPAIPKGLPSIFIRDGGGFLTHSTQQLLHSLVQGGRRIIFEFGNCVHDPIPAGTGCPSSSFVLRGALKSCSFS